MPHTRHEILEEAIFSIRNYRKPELSEARAVLDPILKAAGLGSLEHDRIENITFSDGMIVVDTSYSTRGCIQSGEYVFPEYLLDEADPVRAATRWGLEKKVSDAQERADEVRRKLVRCEEILAEAKAALAQFDAAA